MARRAKELQGFKSWTGVRKGVHSRMLKKKFTDPRASAILKFLDTPATASIVTWNFP
jgi:hypothetical protein